MADEFLNIGSPVKDFVSSFLEQVDKGAKEKGFPTKVVCFIRCKKQRKNTNKRKWKKLQKK